MCNAHVIHRVWVCTCGAVVCCAAGTITYIRKENCLYQSCPSADCKKKVTEGMGGHGFFCEKCNQHFQDFRWRLMLSVSVGEGVYVCVSVGGRCVSECECREGV